MSNEKNELNRILDILDNMNSRLSAIEEVVNIPKSGVVGTSTAANENVYKETSEEREFRFGEQWFAKIGIIAFMLAVINFLVLPFDSISHHIILIAGYFISFALIGFSLFGSRILKNLSGYTLGSGLILLFISTLRLHFFGSEPVINSISLLIILLYLVTAVALTISLNRKSVHLTVLSMIFFYVTTQISDYAILIFTALIIGAIGISYLDKKNGWNLLSVIAILLTYTTHLLWYVNSPLMGKVMLIRPEWNLNLLLIPVYLLIFGLTNVTKVWEEIDDFYSVQNTILNSFLGYGLFLFIAVNSNFNIAGWLNLITAIVLLFLASLHWTKQKSKFSTFLYAMLAYASLSASIMLISSFPNYFIWLCWQSIAVVSTALWFRSKFIVVANFFIFILLFTSYLVAQGLNMPLSALSFGVVALISARIMNWQKERLELKTNNLRIAYLILAFISIPLVLYLNLPTQFVGISYIGLALVYYFIGRIISNQKYRLMATGTLILSIIYILIFGLTSSNTTYKIISFLLVSIAFVFISIVYAKARAKEKELQKVE